MNPFITLKIGVQEIGACSAQDRIAMVRRFDLIQCRAALNLPHLQATVIQAIERRLRAIQRDDG